MRKASLAQLAGGVSVALTLATSPTSDACNRKQGYHSESRSVETNVVEVVSEFQEALVKRNAERVLQMIAKEGLALGPDPDLVSLQEMEKDFKSHGEIYCGFFDGECLRQNDQRQRARDGMATRVPSMLALAEHVAGTPLETTIQQPDAASAIVKFKRLDRTERGSMELKFERRDGKWVVTEFPTW
jgi:hypothetical protein